MNNCLLFFSSQLLHTYNVSGSDLLPEAFRAERCKHTLNVNTSNTKRGRMVRNGRRKRPITTNPTPNLADTTNNNHKVYSQ
jgi:hypothetical protein